MVLLAYVYQIFQDSKYWGIDDAFNRKKGSTIIYHIRKELAGSERISQ